MQIKAVFHIDENEKWKLLIANLQNMIQVITNESFEIEVVANSVAVKEFKKIDSSISNQLKELSNIGIKICACRNALNNLMIKPMEIFEFIEIVPVGVKEIIEKQLNGFAYIKP